MLIRIKRDLDNIIFGIFVNKQFKIVYTLYKTIQTTMGFENDSYEKVKVFRRFFNKNYPKIKNFSLKILKVEEDAEDVTQDIFIKYWERPDLWYGKESIDNLLFIIARNVIFNFLKRKSIFDNQLIELSDDSLGIQVSDWISPDDELQAEETKLLIQMTLEHMPEKRKHVFLMHKMEGLSAVQIAEKLDISVRTVEHHIYRAMVELKKVLFLLFFSHFV